MPESVAVEFAPDKLSSVKTTTRHTTARAPDAPASLYLEASALDPRVRRVIEAYGGVELWRHAECAQAVIRVSGLVTWLKMRRPLRAMSVVTDIHRPYARLDPIDRVGHVGVLDGRDVRLEDAHGRVIEERVNARRLFPGGRRRFYWDRLDLTYFLGYAIWHYFALPALLMRNDVEWRTREDGALEALFPPWLPTHSRRQAFHVDPQTYLVQSLEYVAEVLGLPNPPAGRPVHFVLGHAVTPDGIPYISHRRAGPPRGPTVVRLRVDHWRLLTG